MRIALIEDNSSFRKRFEKYCTLVPKIVIVGSYASGEAALNALLKITTNNFPDIILIDIGLPKMSGIETLKKLKKEFSFEAIMFTTFENDDLILESIQNGASGYILKDDPPEKVIDALDECLRGGAPMSDSIARKILKLMQVKQNVMDIHQARKYSLTEREITVLSGLVNGQSYQTIAQELYLSPFTVRTHIKNIYKKLDVNSRASVVKIAVDNNLTQ